MFAKQTVRSAAKLPGVQELGGLGDPSLLANVCEQRSPFSNGIREADTSFFMIYPLICHSLNVILAQIGTVYFVHGADLYEA